MVDAEIRAKAETKPEAVEPIYCTDSVDQEICLYRGLLVLTESGRNHTGHGEIDLRWVPGPRARFKFTPETPVGFVEGDVGLEVPGDRFFPILVTETTQPSGVCSGMLKPEKKVPKPVAADEVIFHLANFWDYVGTHVRRSLNHFWMGRLTWEWDDWKIELDRLPGVSKQLRDEARDQEGFIVTNVGRLTRQGEFSLEEAIEVLTRFGEFLSFCRGNWCYPILPLAYRQGTLVWEQWTPKRVGRYRSVLSWFPRDEHRPKETLTDLFAGFMKVRERWGRDLARAIHWYNGANTSSVDSSLIWAQTALDLVGWLHLVQDEVMSSSRYKKLGARESIRKLLTELEIPTDIGSDLSDLQSLAGIEGWSDGVDCVVKLRNALVHPNPSSRKLLDQIGDGALFEAAQQSLWFLELALLKLMGYEGEYRSRLIWKATWVGEAYELVPWAQNSTS